MLNEKEIKDYLNKLEERLEHEQKILPVQQMKEGQEECLKDIERLKIRIETIKSILKL